MAIYQENQPTSLELVETDLVRRLAVVREMAPGNPVGDALFRELAELALSIARERRAEADMDPG